MQTKSSTSASLSTTQSTLSVPSQACSCLIQYTQVHISQSAFWLYNQHREYVHTQYLCQHLSWASSTSPSSMHHHNDKTTHPPPSELKLFQGGFPETSPTSQQHLGLLASLTQRASHLPKTPKKQRWHQLLGRHRSKSSCRHRREEIWHQQSWRRPKRVTSQELFLWSTVSSVSSTSITRWSPQSWEGRWR